MEIAELFVEGLVGNLTRAKTISGTILFLATVIAFPLLATADNPTSARVAFSVERTNLKRNGLEDLVIRVTHSFPAGQEVETGGSCSVELSACLSRFLPLGQTSTDRRQCSKVTIGSKTVAAGGKTARFLMMTKPVQSPPHVGRQVSFQTRSTCTDSGSNQVVIDSSPRAKKISRPDTKGVGQGKFYRLLQESLR